MAKQEKQEARKGASKVAATIAKVLNTVDNQGNMVTQVVASVKAVYKGEPVPKVDLSFIADRVAIARAWSEASAKARKSEVRRIVEAYDTLPEAIQLYKKKADTFTWHQAVKLARLLNSNTPKQAVAAMVSVVAGNRPKPMAVFNAAITRIVNLQTTSKNVIAFRRDLTKLLSKHNLA